MLCVPHGTLPHGAPATAGSQATRAAPPVTRRQPYVLIPAAVLTHARRVDTLLTLPRRTRWGCLLPAGRQNTGERPHCHQLPVTRLACPAMILVPLGQSTARRARALCIPRPCGRGMHSASR